MKIQELTLKNFHNHEETKLKLNRVNIFTGDLGSGKTSIIKAIDTLLKPRNKITNINKSVKTNTTSATLGCKLKIDKDEYNTIKEIKVASDTCTTNGDKTADIIKKLGINESIMSAIIDVHYFTSIIDDAARNNILSTILTDNMEKDEFKTLVLDLLQESDKEIVGDFIDENYDNIKNSSKKGICQQLHKIAHDSRRDLRKDKATQLEIITNNEEELNKLPKEEQKVDQEKIERTAQVTSINNDISKKKEAIEELQSSLNERKEKVTKIEAAIAEYANKIDNDNITEEQLQNEVKKQTLLESQISGIKKSLESVKNINSSSDIKCPYFSECKYENAKDDIDQVCNRLNSSIEEKQEHLNNVIEISDSFRTTLGHIQKVTELKDLLNLANQKNSENLNTLHRLEEEYKTLQNEANKLTDMGILSSVDMDQTDIIKNRAILEDRINTAKTQIKKIDTKLNAMERCINIFSDTRVIAKSMAKLDEFYKILRDILDVIFPIYETKIEDDMSITFSGIHIDTLSTSEKFRTGIALQVAISLFTNVNLVCIDGIDIIANPELRNQTIKKIESIEDLETIIINSSVEHDGFETIHIKDGKVV